MGTNYYFVTKSRQIAHKYFAEVESWGTYDEEYKLCDIPDFHYEIHLNKLSYGWQPLFQKHKAFQTFAQLEEFYLKHQKYLKIYDEYEREYTWDKYKQEIIDHASREPEPVKWVYDEDTICGKSGRKYLHAVKCEPEEAELWIPIDHIDYSRTQNEAIDLLGVADAYPWDGADRYHRDPDYNIDWMEGDFS